MASKDFKKKTEKSVNLEPTKPQVIEETESPSEILEDEAKVSEDYIRDFEKEVEFDLPYKQGKVTVKGEVTLNGLKEIFNPIRNPKGGFYSPKISGRIQLTGLETIRDLVVKLGTNFREYGKYLYSVETTLVNMIKAKRARIDSLKRRTTITQRSPGEPYLANTGKSINKSDVKSISLVNLSPSYEKYDKDDFESTLKLVPSESKPGILDIWEGLKKGYTIPTKILIQNNIFVEDGVLKYFINLPEEGKLTEITLKVPGK